MDSRSGTEFVRTGPSYQVDALGPCSEEIDLDDITNSLVDRNTSRLENSNNEEMKEQPMNPVSIDCDSCGSKSLDARFYVMGKAAEKNRPDLIERILHCTGANINEVNCHGSTLLCQYAKLGDVRAVEYLIQYGADVNQTDIDGCSPYMIAYLRGHENVMLLFASQGAFTYNEQNQQGDREDIEDSYFNYSTSESSEE